MAEHTFEGREAAIEDQFKITQLSFRQNNSGKGLSFGCELGVSGEISRDQIFKNAAVRWVRHVDYFFFFCLGKRWYYSGSVLNRRKRGPAFIDEG